MKDSWLKAPKEGWLHRTLYKKKEERFSSPKGDRLIEKIAKKQGKKNKRFSFAETDALLTEKKNNFLFALELIIVPHF